MLRKNGVKRVRLVGPWGANELKTVPPPRLSASSCAADNSSRDGQCSEARYTPALDFLRTTESCGCGHLLPCMATTLWVVTSLPSTLLLSL